MAKRQFVPRTRGGGRYTEAEFFSFIRSALRQKSRRWAPIYSCLNSAKRASKSDNKRLKWEYQCNKCKSWSPQRGVSIDHIKPAGTLRSLEDLPAFVSNLFCEEDNLQCLCHACHKEKTSAEKKLGQRK